MAKDPAPVADAPVADPKPNVVARVLRHIDYGDEQYHVNDVVEFDADTAARLVSEGAIDPDPAAVAYAESLAS